jgi:hypothetical protein
MRAVTDSCEEQRADDRPAPFRREEVRMTEGFVLLAAWGQYLLLLALLLFFVVRGRKR